jgi:hypothetical protein
VVFDSGRKFLVTPATVTLKALRRGLIIPEIAAEVRKTDML